MYSNYMCPINNHQICIMDTLSIYKAKHMAKRGFAHMSKSKFYVLKRHMWWRESK